ncbi:hypothetical protein D9757_006570 [Collybiopsis confluens]|uniref:Uncharacterized protein n=1 Tax=Collybiopsis confluens TaxID=2823264 RepID=A0A8H5HQT4_9AGAR|nr:hypothetical protein D9757_006570 [Collybiopsis confluens]
MSNSGHTNPLPHWVLVTGGGPNVLVTPRNLVERGNFELVELVERRDDVGGVWYLDNPDVETAGFFDPKLRWPSPAYHCIRRPALPDCPTLPDSRVIDVPPVKRYVLQSMAPAPGEYAQEKITAVLEDGTEINDVDVVLLGTGYRPDSRFIHILRTPLLDAAQPEDEPGSGISPPLVPLMSLLLTDSPH